MVGQHSMKLRVVVGSPQRHWWQDCLIGLLCGVPSFSSRASERESRAALHR